MFEECFEDAKIAIQDCLRGPYPEPQLVLLM